MEEIDKIVIQVLRQIGCSLDDDVTNLTQFTPEMLVSCVSRCLTTIRPDLELPKTLPPVGMMAQRYAVTQKLTESIKDVGFRGDVGYQTLLYSNTIEVRRVLMYLVEKLPKETDRTAVHADESDDPVSVKEREIAANMSAQLNSPWVPVISRRQMKFPFRPKTLSVPFVTQRDVTEEIKEYWRHYSPSIYDQTTPENLRPSVIHTLDKMRHAKVHASASYDSLRMVESNLSKSSSVEAVSMKSADQKLLTELIRHDEGPNEVDELSLVVETLKDSVESKFLDLHELETLLKETEDELKKEQDEIKAIEIEKRTEDRLEILLEDPENSVEKLEERIGSSNLKMEKLKMQWETHRQPVQEQLDTAKQKYDEKDKKVLLEIERTRSTYENLAEDLRSKASVQAKLVQELEKLIEQSSPRAAYTSRILEIIANIKKQDAGIDRILLDTRKLQKEINTIIGHLEREFTATDDLIFRSAKHDEYAKRSYKLLATLHADCGDLVALVEETGTVIREVRELEDQIDMERAKNVAANLQQVEADLNEIKKSC